MNNKGSNDSIIYKHKLRKHTILALWLLIISTILFAFFSFLFLCKHEFAICFFTCLLLTFVFMFFTFICDKKEKNYKLPPINNLDNLNSYLSYFLSTDISDFNYALSLSWISKLIVEANKDSQIEQNKVFKNHIVNLYKITRPYGSSNGYCFATYRREAFKKLVEKIIDKKATDSDYEAFLDEDATTDLSDKKFLLSNLSLIVFVALIIVHIIAIIVYFLWEPSESQNKSVLIEIMHEVATIIPSDVLMLLIYLGLVKETKNDKN